MKSEYTLRNCVVSPALLMGQETASWLCLPRCDSVPCVNHGLDRAGGTGRNGSGCEGGGGGAGGGGGGGDQIVCASRFGYGILRGGVGVGG